jgi:STE24 endopeptidase
MNSAENIETASPEPVELDPARQRVAKEYASIQRRLSFLELGLTALALVVLLFSGWSAALRDWAGSISRETWLVVGLYAVALGAIFTLLTLPLDFYSGYVLPKRYGLLTQSVRGWVVDTMKNLALGAAFGLAGIELLYWLLRTFPDWWWLIMSVLLWLFTVVIAQLAPVLIMPLFYQFRPLDDPDLVARLTALAERAGTRVRGVYVMDMSSRTTTANAMLAGLGRTRRIILGDTLLRDYTPDEIQTVLAHEMAHHVHNDLIKSLVAQAVLIPLSLWVASIFLSWGVTAFGFRGIDDVAAFPLFIAAMSIFGLITMPAGNFLTRRMERAADRYALDTTRNGPAFRSAMLKLASQNLADADPPAWVRFLFYSHPPISERVRMAEQQT